MTTKPLTIPLRELTITDKASGETFTIRTRSSAEEVANAAYDRELETLRDDVVDEYARLCAPKSAA